ncbi:hypothetical protein [Tissierella sp. Yu-01]|nr:hypothetical protein [Tissierella sp. Yu-01]WFA10369.1 hypothetical protein P3962_07395 [Tissierella sp. Yu-01]
MVKTIKGAGDFVTIELCQMYAEIGFDCIWTDGKNLTLIEKVKDLPAATE